MNVGRPTKYTPELLSRAREYLSGAWQGTGSVIPSHQGLALYLEITKTCLYDWAKQEDKAEFSAILDNIMTVQHEVLINKGLTGDFNSNITKLALGKHGYTDKQDLTSKDQPLQVFVNTFANRTPE